MSIYTLYVSIAASRETKHTQRRRAGINHCKVAFGRRYRLDSINKNPFDYGCEQRKKKQRPVRAGLQEGKFHFFQLEIL